jgi:hypothetical protein
VPRLSIAPDGTHLLREGRPFPLIIDTAWSAFADPTVEEWRVYLAARRRQGFRAVLITALPVLHDRVERSGAREPFYLDAGGHHDFARPDHSYFAAAREYVRIAQQEFALEVMIAVLWNNYLPGTWGAAATPQAVMPVDARRDFVIRVADAFAELEPIFVVGGDDDYTVPEANAAYLEAIGVLRERASSSLLTTHSTPNAIVPDEILDSLDFHLHQSGHNVENQLLTWQQPARYLARVPRKPLVNSEPPYELHGKVGGNGRWTRDEVRAASWESILGGSTAGIGYGAHGTWMWATTTGVFHAALPSLAPFTWPEALALPGALDVSLMSRLFDDHAFHTLEPAQQLLTDDRAGRMRAAASADRSLVVVYLPFALEVEVRLDLRAHRITAWDLQARAPLTPDAHHLGGSTRFGQLFSSSDQLIVAERVT